LDTAHVAHSVDLLRDSHAPITLLAILMSRINLNRITRSPVIASTPYRSISLPMFTQSGNGPSSLQ
jgi:hypothetical protein